MVNTVKNITLLFFFIGILLAQDNSRIDYYSKEIPLYPVPEEMTFEEYQDLNRDIGIAFLKMALMPIPGTIHSYANEPKTAKKLRRLFAGGLLSILVGASIMEEEDWRESSYPITIINENSSNERRYEMLPVEITGTDTTYILNELGKDYTGGGNILMPLGIGMLIYSYFYDLHNGVKIIEQKRHAVRVLKTAQKNEISAGKDPMGLAAAALYLACVKNGEDKTQRDIAEAANVTEVTIRNRYKGLKDSE